MVNYHEIKLSVDTNKTVDQNAKCTHKKDSLHVFLYFTTDLQRKPNQRFFKTEPKPKPNRTHGFSKNRNETEPEKSIPHIPRQKEKLISFHYLLFIISNEQEYIIFSVITVCIKLRLMMKATWTSVILTCRETTTELVCDCTCRLWPLSCSFANCKCFKHTVRNS